MRVRYVCADRGVPVFGTKGASIHLREMIHALTRQGATVDLVAVRRGDGSSHVLPGVQLEFLDVQATGDPARLEQGMFGANESMRAILERLPRPDLVYERHALWSFAAMEWARDRGIASVLEVNAPLVEEQARHRTLVNHELAERCARRAMQAAGAVAVVSRELVPVVIRYGADEGRVHVVPNGIDPARFPAVARERAPDAMFTVGFVGSLKPWHGLDLLADAFTRVHRALPRARLLVVGDGPERAGFEQQVTDSGVREAVEMTGAVDYGEIPGLLERMDVAVLPYPRLEGFYFSPLKLYEAMASGLPVVASRIGQIGEVIDDGVNGLLCPAGDAEAIANGLVRLAGDPGERKRLGLAARERVMRDYTWDANARRVMLIGSIAAPVEAN